MQGEADFIIEPAVKLPLVLVQNFRHFGGDGVEGGGVHEVVYVEELHARQLSHLGLNVPGDGQIHHHLGQLGHRFQLFHRNGVVGAGGGGDQNVHPVQQLKAAVIGLGLAPRGHHGLPVAVGAQGHHHPAPGLMEQPGG